MQNKSKQSLVKNLWSTQTQQQTNLCCSVLTLCFLARLATSGLALEVLVWKMCKHWNRPQSSVDMKCRMKAQSTPPHCFLFQLIRGIMTQRFRAESESWWPISIVFVSIISPYTFTKKTGNVCGKYNTWIWHSQFVMRKRDLTFTKQCCLWHQNRDQWLVSHAKPFFSLDGLWGSPNPRWHWMSVYVYVCVGVGVCVCVCGRAANPASRSMSIIAYEAVETGKPK